MSLKGFSVFFPLEQGENKWRLLGYVHRSEGRVVEYVFIYFTYLNPLTYVYIPIYII